MRRYKACTVCELRFRTTEQIDDEGEHFPLRERKIGSKLTPQKVSELRRLKREDQVSYDELARRYGITKNYAVKIVNRHVWKHIF